MSESPIAFQLFSKPELDTERHRKITRAVSSSMWRNSWLSFQNGCVVSTSRFPSGIKTSAIFPVVWVHLSSMTASRFPTSQTRNTSASLVFYQTGGLYLTQLISMLLSSVFSWTGLGTNQRVCQAPHTQKWWVVRWRNAGTGSWCTVLELTTTRVTDFTVQKKRSPMNNQKPKGNPSRIVTQMYLSLNAFHETSRPFYQYLKDEAEGSVTQKAELKHRKVNKIVAHVRSFLKLSCNESYSWSC